MSTLTITVHEPAPILGNNPGENPIAAALSRAWRNFVALFAGLIASLGVVIPLALVGLPGWYGYRRWKIGTVNTNLKTQMRDVGSIDEMRVQ